MDADARLRALYTEEWEWRRDQFPDAEHWDPASPIPDRFPRVDDAAQAERLAHWTEMIRRVDAIPLEELSAAERVNQGVLRPQLASLLDNQRFRTFEMPVDSDSSFWIAAALTGNRAFVSDGDHERFLAQLRDFPRYAEEQVEQMRHGVARGFTPPRITLAGREQTITRVLDADPEATSYFAPFAGPEPHPLADEARDVIRDMVQPVYARLLPFFRDEYVPRTRTTIACADLPDGEAYYRARIREYTTLDLEPREIHEIGLEQVAVLAGRMRAAAASAGHPGDLRAFIEALQADPRSYPRDGEELLLRACGIAKRFDAVASSYFGRVPRARMAIKPVPDEIAPFYTVGRATAGTYLLNLYQPETRALYNLPALTLHEGEPGHVFQLALALESGDQPDFRRFSYLSAYGEGWALYAEELGLEMGIYASPEERFGMLSGQMWRAVRLVIDTGIHSLGWTRERAIEYLGGHTALPSAEVVLEVDRYISWPGQALSYYLGKLAVVRARQRAEEALGARFDIRGFHDTVLASGSVPLPLLDALVDEDIARRREVPGHP